MRRALEIDSDFVDAYSGLSIAYVNEGLWREYREAALQAYRRAARFPEPVRLSKEIDYLDSRYEYDEEIERLKADLQLYPFNSGAANHLAWLYIALGDPAAAEIFARQAFTAAADTNNLDMLGYTLELQGKADELETLAAEYRRRGGKEEEALVGSALAAMVRGDWRRVEALVSSRRSEPGSYAFERFGEIRLTAHLATGRLDQARRDVGELLRTGRGANAGGSRTWTLLMECWLRMRRNEPLEPALQDLVAQMNRTPFLGYLPHFSLFCLEAKLALPLAAVIERQEADLAGLKSRYVREELQFARGCLELVEGHTTVALNLLEPLDRSEEIRYWRRALGRAYEAERNWRAASIAYEDVFSQPFRWALFEHNPAVWVLDQYWLGQVYEHLGDTVHARQWYEKFLSDWKDADPDIPELSEAKTRLAALGSAENPSRAGPGETRARTGTDRVVDK